MKVLKFGGTSVGSTPALNNVLNIIQLNLTAQEKIVVVCSALSGITNKLLEAGKIAATGDAEYIELLNQIENRHITIANSIINSAEHESINALIKQITNELGDVLRGVFLLKEMSLRSEDLVLSFGEVLSCSIITKYLQQHGIVAKFIDSRSLIKTDENFGNAKVDFAKTNNNLQEFFKQFDFVPIVTGFIASNSKNETTTLGRGGSDYTAAIVGAGINTDTIEIWTDVNGVMTADPKYVKKAFTVPNISYKEAIELSHFGAKIIYSPTLQPVFKKRIPLLVKNTLEHDHPGTLVSEQTSLYNNYLIKGISSINTVAMLVIQGSGMVGLPGFLGRMFRSIAQKNINVLLATQGSSEYSICVIVAANDGLKAAIAVNEEFDHEIINGHVDRVAAKTDYSVIAIIGEGMRKHSGLAGKFFSGLGKNGINIIAIAQGASELNISAIIESKDLHKALNVTHDIFFDSDLRSLNLFMVGTGLIGSTLLKQIEQNSQYLLKEKNLNINLIGLMNSKTMVIDENGIDLNKWPDRLKDSTDKANINKMVATMQAFNMPNTVFVDCTSNKDIVTHYQSILESIISIVTPNKIANSSSYTDYIELKQIATKNAGKFMYETNVGAGLPVINTLQNLKLSGDKVIRIEGVLSGTLSYIFNNFIGDKKFSDVVKEAKENGYTEPDPREDLNGNDVARKILILAREVGANIEISDIIKENILPESCYKANTVDEFFVELERNNHIFEARKIQAEKESKVLRFLAKYENGVASINLAMIDSAHPFYSLSGSDNIISFTTERYFTRPLVIQGPGAGAEVTASGLFAEIIAISNYLKN